MRSTLLLLCASLALAGCGGRDVDLGDGGAAATTISGHVFQGEQDHKVQGAVVAQYGGSAQTTTDAAGAYGLALTPGPVVLVAQKAGLLRTLNSAALPAGGVAGVDLALVSRTYIDAKLAQAKLPKTDLSRGLVVVVFKGANGGEGASLAQASDGVMTVMKGTDQGVQSKTLLSGGSRALVFSNVAPGVTTVTLSAPGCTPRHPSLADYPVVAGALSMIDVTCK